MLEEICTFGKREGSCSLDFSTRKHNVGKVCKWFMQISFWKIWFKGFYQVKKWYNLIFLWNCVGPDNYTTGANSLYFLLKWFLTEFMLTCVSFVSVLSLQIEILTVYVMNSRLAEHSSQSFVHTLMWIQNLNKQSHFLNQ